ncbi:MAG: CBS domain-containing protein [Verrucomicrobiota bacterium]
MIVSMWMTRTVAVIDAAAPIAEAASVMALRRIRRLPVVEQRADGPHLVGIVSAKDILHAVPPDVNPFAVLGLENRQAPEIVGHIMSQRLVLATPETPIETAATLMTENKIGALPVVRTGTSTLVGLITESDIFRAFVSFFASDQPGARITFDISGGEDVFRLVQQAAHRHHVRVVSLITSRQEDRPVCVVRIAGQDVDGMLDEIWGSGHRVLNVLRFGEKG